MQYRLFQYPLPADPELAELNSFLANHRIATVKQQIVSTSGGAMLVFVVELAASATDAPASRSGGKARIDYRDILSEEEFQIFSRLRERRKELAAEEGVPVYAVFSNAQLAEMVQKKLTSKSDLAKIAGVGDARADKYAEHLLAILSAAFETGETSEPEGGA